METKAILNFMTVFISQVPDFDHRKQLEHALASTQALLAGENPEDLVPPHIPKPMLSA